MKDAAAQHRTIESTFITHGSDIHMTGTLEEEYSVNLLHIGGERPRIIRDERCEYSRALIRPYDIALVLTGGCSGTNDSREHGDPPSPVQGLPPFLVDNALRAVHESQVRVLLVAQPVIQVSDPTECSTTQQPHPITSSSCPEYSAYSGASIASSSTSCSTELYSAAEWLR